MIPHASHPGSQSDEGVTIAAVDPESPAARRGIRPGDRLIRIGETPIRDEIDLRFAEASERPRVTVERGGRRRRIDIPKRYEEHLGLEIEEFAVRRCRNRCVFCFVSQQPAGLRPSLYVKDDDYRLSFLHGAYITGENLTSEDLERIERQRLAPLYISVHTTDPATRGRLLGLDRPAPVLPLIDFLAERALPFQTQIVLCPGWNDGAVLGQTLDDLVARHPACESIAIVPVGLTRHRRRLPRIAPVTPARARRLVDETAALRRRLARRCGEDIVYLSDEIHLLAGRPAPAYPHRPYWRQIENGVGMVHDFYRGFRSSSLPRRVRRSGRFALVTGAMGVRALERFVAALNRVDGLYVRALRVPNRLLGEKVTVSGLLGAEDILRAARRAGKATRLVLPPDCLNADGRFLDDVAWERFSRKLNDAPILGGRTALETAERILAATQR